MWVVVGASGGLGQSLIRQLLARGEAVLGVSRHPPEALLVGKRHGAPLAGQLSAELRESSDNAASFRWVAADVTNAESLEALQIDRPLSGVINAAGLLHEPGTGLAPEKRIADVKLANLERVFAVNSFSTLLLAKALQAHMPRRGRFVFAQLSARVGSIADNRLGGWYAYRASKAAANMFVKGLAIEWARRNPDAVVLALHPGTVRTHLSDPFSGNAKNVFEPADSARQLLGVIDRATPADTGKFYAYDGSEIPW